MPLENGTFLAERYRIERILGQGGMGAVYLAQDETLGVQVAVKENLNVSPESERQFKREATLLASLRHQHLPRVTNHFVLGGQQYLVMDYVEGEDLKQRLTRAAPLPEADVRLWGAQICDALTYLHGLTPPVVHRDIKPGNIKLTAQGDAMLVDFGIAKASGSGQKTTTAAAAFTPGYAPPEQYGMGRTDPRTDQYALAATLYTLLTNHTPPDSMERLLGNTALTPPETLRPDISPAMGAALTRALELRTEDRFDSVAKFKAVMLGEAPMTQPTRRPTQPETRLAEQGASATVMGAAPTVPGAAPTVKGATAVGAPTTAAAQPAWLLPVVIGAVVVFLLGGAALAYAAYSGLTRATATAPVTEAAVVVATATLLPATPTAAPATATTLPASETAPAQPTDTATPAPPTATAAPLAIATQVGQGGRIAFISNRDGKNYQIYTMNPDGSDVQLLTTDPRDKWSPKWQLGRLGPLPGSLLTWSPDGKQLLYSAELAPDGPVDLWVINADGSDAQDLTAPTEAGRPHENAFQPAWCADGTIAFTSIRNNSPQVFIIASLTNRQLRNYSTTRANPLEYNPLFFADCRRMLVITTQNGSGELWRIFPFPDVLKTMWATFPSSSQFSYRVFRSEISQGNVILDAALAPDDKQYVFTRQSPSPLGNNLILGTVEDSQLNMKFRTLTIAKSDTTPRWSPDGRYLIFVSRRDQGNPQIFRMTAGGTEQTNLSRNTANELSPAWQPAPKP